MGLVICSVDTLSLYEAVWYSYTYGCYNNNNNNSNSNNNLLQLGCYPVAVVILRVYRI